MVKNCGHQVATVESISEMETAKFLNKEQLLKLLEATPVGYVKPTFPPSPQPPAYTKLGVVIDIVDIVGAASKPNIKNHSTSQSYICSECRRILPTAHLLDLHITEQHDLYFAASVERQNKPMYSCYLEECPAKFSTVKERKGHCITVHKFPANYRFDQDKGEKKQNAISSACNPSSSMDTDEIQNSASTIKAFTFGHQKQRAFNTRPEKHNRNPLGNVQDLKEAIDDIMD